MNVADIASSLNLLGLVAFGFLVKGLKERIENLTLLAKEQKETLDAVRTRSAELDQMRKDYRQGLDDFQDLGRKLEERRGELVREQEQAIKAKDTALANFKEVEIEQLQLQKKSLERIPEIEEQLSTTLGELKQLSVVLSSSSEPSVRRVALNLGYTLHGSVNQFQTAHNPHAWSTLVFPDDYPSRAGRYSILPSVLDGLFNWHSPHFEYIYLVHSGTADTPPSQREFIGIENAQKTPQQLDTAAWSPSPEGATLSIPVTPARSIDVVFSALPGNPPPKFIAVLENGMASPMGDWVPWRVGQIALKIPRVFF